MGIISVERANNLLWLGRYSERVYTTLRMFYLQFDKMIESEKDEFSDFCSKLNIPVIYTSNEDFISRYLYDSTNPDSVLSNLLRAYDNAVVLINAGCYDFYKRIAAGKVSGDWTALGKDAAGNQYIYGRISAPHTAFSVEVEGTARVSSGAGYKKEATREMLYRFPTALTICTEEMERFLMNFRKRWPEMKEAALMPSKLRAEQQSFSFRKNMKNLMEAVFCHMEYVPSATTVTTTAGSAFAMKKGVCQDYAHIMIAFCRRMGIPAAYVAGYMMGEGASHAWVSVCDQSTGTWYEIDPTNDRWVDDDYIRVAVGCDAGDCVMNRGLYRGTAKEQQEIVVIVEEKYDKKCGFNGSSCG